MKTIVKIEIAILVVVVLVATGMILFADGWLDWLRDPVIVEQKPAAIATDASIEETAPEETVEPEVTEEPEAPTELQSQDSTEPTEPRVITAKRYFAYDTRQEDYLVISGNADARLYPASITKLLTCYVLMQYMDLEETVVAGNAMELVQEESSLAGIEIGDVLTVEQLIAAMILPSGNDAAQVAAVAAGRKIADNQNLSPASAAGVFVKKMNETAKELGMVNSHFENPDGFHHDNHYSTMNDLVVLCKTVLADETILKYASRAKDAIIMPERMLEWKNTNVLLQPDSVCYLPNTIGLKTGYTGEAGSCLVSAFFEEDRIWIIGVFGCPAYTEDRYLDTVAIYNSL